MKKEKCVKAEINADGRQVSILSLGRNNDYISLTDIARYKSDDPNDVIKNWMRGKDVIQFLGLWEKLNNPDFKPVEFDGFKMEAGTNAFTLSPQKWITATNAIGIISKAGRYGGTFAHTDIAFEFASWISAEFKLYIIKDYQRLKNDENSNSSLGWNLNRELVKINYRIHTDAIKENLIPESMANKLQGIVYANEADILNVALFGMTAKQWREANPSKNGNVRDYVSTIELAILSNLEFYNSKLIEENIPPQTRLIILNNEANKEKELFNKNNEKVIKINNNE